MFIPPNEISTRVFARLPEALRVTGRDSSWNTGRNSAPLPAFFEGPAFDREGNLYVVDIPYGRILRITPSATFSVVVEYDGWPNGLAIHKEGSIWIADYRRGILRLNPHNGKVEPIIETIHREGLKGVNDLTFAFNGDLYFTDQGQTGMHDPSGRVYRLKANGQIDRLIDNVPSPNGLVLNRDQNVLLVAVTRSNEIWRLPLLPDGTTTKVAAFIRLSGGLIGPDGLAMDSEDNLAVAQNGLGTVWVFNRLGEPMLRIRSCEGLTVTNLAFGGQDGRQLFITESATNTILVADMPVAGQPLYSHS